MAVQYRKIYTKETTEVRKAKRSRAKKALFFSNILLISGFITLAYFVLNPILLSVFSKPKSISFIKPFSGTVLGVAYTSIDDGFYFSELENYKKEASQKEVSKNTPATFTLTIPKLGIKNAIVHTNSIEMSPDDFLGHYKGTSIPGEAGNSFIYGHSTLPFFYDPTNYKTIFTKIPELESGDIIKVNISGKALVYKVRVGKELLPKEVDPYGQYYSGMYNKSTITLMTCTPPGTKKYRYIVLAELQ